MKIAISYKNVEAPGTVNPAVEMHIKKIGVLLKTYQRDLVKTP